LLKRPLEKKRRRRVDGHAGAAKSAGIVAGGLRDEGSVEGRRGAG